MDCGDADKLKATTEKLSNEIQPIFAKLYQQASPNGAPNGNADGSGSNGGNDEFHQN